MHDRTECWPWFRSANARYNVNIAYYANPFICAVNGFLRPPAPRE